MVVWNHVMPLKKKFGDNFWIMSKHGFVDPNFPIRYQNVTSATDIMNQ